MKKKSQIQTLETVAVLFVFFFLISISMIFISTYQKGKLEVARHEVFQRQAGRIAKSVVDIPEFRTTKKGIKGTNSFDLLKMISFSEVVKENPDLEFGLYKEKFGNSHIVVHSIYPIRQDYPIYGTFLEDYKGDRYPYFIPVSLYNPLDSSMTFALLEVQYYAE